MRSTPAHFSIDLASGKQKPAPASGHTITIGAHAQVNALAVGDHNHQQVRQFVEEMTALIDRSDAPEAEKQEARSRLRQFLDVPIIASALGSSFGAAVASLLV